jgi:hypothetical protein
VSKVQTIPFWVLDDADTDGELPGNPYVCVEVAPAVRFGIDGFSVNE